MESMIAEPFDQPPTEPSPPFEPAPPPSPAAPQGGGRARTGNPLTIALLLIGGLAGGALGAEVVISRLPAASTASTTTTASSSSPTSAVATQPLSAAAIYQQASLGVVTITTEIARRGRVGEGTGSGIVLDQNGDILTNAHVIAGANQIQVTFSDGKTASASVAGSSTSADLAIIKVSVASSSLHPVPLGNSDAVRVGDAAYAIGAPFGLPESMSAGIVSGLNRSNPGSGLTGLIQTDAPINPGNSGGALLNTLGQVIGVNDSIESPVAGNVGIGFAIPINTVKQLLSSLEGGANQ
jgi:S1-C subfamily serine protease